MSILHLRTRTPKKQRNTGRLLLAIATSVGHGTLNTCATLMCITNEKAVSQRTTHARTLSKFNHP
jgi:hypothetical protein